jgi:hypothetical protein
MHFENFLQKILIELDFEIHCAQLLLFFNKNFVKMNKKEALAAFFVVRFSILNRLFAI